jgi:hypothetical protein
VRVTPARARHVPSVVPSPIVPFSAVCRSLYRLQPEFGTSRRARGGRLPPKGGTTNGTGTVVPLTVDGASGPVGQTLTPV